MNEEKRQRLIIRFLKEIKFSKSAVQMCKSIILRLFYLQNSSQVKEGSLRLAKKYQLLFAFCTRHLRRVTNQTSS